MAQRDPNAQSLPDQTGDLLDHADDWGPESPTQIDLDGDLQAAVRRAGPSEGRFVVRQDGEELAAIVSMDDFRLLLRLEEEELDRIDIEEVRRLRADPNEQERIPLEQVKADLGLS